ncbi:uncharacterized protein BCR38DRAFT_498792 [Pseudomassariella vexata]|uniref:Aminoglycoside phosphotransferase domain-containing protein n=1 Tax=Pseudomassariella vexata TaxID=1141098 RepID=A0A1Y2DIR4_9PEZI|nr:uncharacterized protein BCR38DRAFT_498792 [Pseudomassariella vexata]ORY59111.1 hypothetical protein BCR38DRAFT_498792 [Pseudomassariella vexata]
MEIFPESSFFKERRAPALPTPDEIRAINKATGGIRSTNFNRPTPVIVPSLGLVVKYGADVAIVEAQIQMMVHKQLQDRTLAERWPSMNENERRYVCEELKQMVNAWRTLEHGGHDHFIGSLGKRPLNEIFLRNHSALAGPFQGADTVQPVQASCDIDIDLEVASVFTHDDLVPCNIILLSGPVPKVAAVIDWGQAGWYPTYWEFCKARRVTLLPKYFDSVSQEEWHNTYLPMIIYPVDEETYYYPWLWFVLSKGI